MANEFIQQELSYAVVEARDNSFIHDKQQQQQQQLYSNDCAAQFFFFTLSWRHNVPNIILQYSNINFQDI